MFKKGDNVLKKKESKRIVKETFGLSVQQLRKWSEDRLTSQMDTEMALQEVAVARVREYLDTLG